MVEFSNKVASASELGNYSEEGYQFEDVYKDPDVLFQDMQKAGVNPDNMTRLDNINKKQIANNPSLVRKKQLKKLFIQYVKKYISNPNKYLQYPKQIKNLPSWFDEALALFNEVEISRGQKKMLREYFYGLIRYRDDKLATSNVGGIVNPEETNRQLGERSPYSASEDNLDTLQLPRQQEARRFDVDTLMRENAQMNVRRATPEIPPEDQFEEYGGINPEEPVSVRYTTTKGNASLGSLGISAVRPSNVEDYVSFGRKRQPQTQPNPEAVPHQKMPFVKSTPPSPSAGAFNPIDVPTRKGMGINLTSFIIGNNKPTIAPVQRQQPGYVNENQQPRTPPAWLRASKKPVVRIQRKKKKSVMVAKKPRQSVFDIQRSTDTVAKMLNNIKDINKIQRTKGVGKIDLKIKLNNINKKKSSKIVKAKPITDKQMSGLESVRNMDKIFSQIKDHSHNNFGKENMKIKLVDNIKDQCNKAFARNKFKQEAVNMKKNFFNDVKNSYPQMKSEIREMGNIRENDMMRAGLRDTTGIIKANRMTSSLGIKRGDMRPEAVGIMDFDFSIDPIRSKGKKKVQLYDEDDFLSRQE